MIKPKKAAAKKPAKRKAATVKKKVVKTATQKFNTGEFVYSYANPNANREISAVQKYVGDMFVYRLKLCDSKGKLKLSVWIAEHYLTKTKRPKYKNPKDLPDNPY